MEHRKFPSYLHVHESCHELHSSSCQQLWFPRDHPYNIYIRTPTKQSMKLKQSLRYTSYLQHSKTTDQRRITGTELSNLRTNLTDSSSLTSFSLMTASFLPAAVSAYSAPCPATGLLCPAALLRDHYIWPATA